MWLCWTVLLTFLIAGLCYGQGNILLTPGPTQYVAEGFSGNVTFVCDVTAQANRSASAVWVINGIQIGSSRVSELQVFGIFIETIVQNTVISISLDGIARQRSQGLGLQCAESIPGFPPQITFSPSISIITYGRPGVPYPLATVQGSSPSVLRWGTPPNLTDAAPVTYTVTASSASLGVVKSYQVNTTELSLSALEQVALSGPNDCQEFNFTVIASLPDVPDSEPAVSTDFIPLSIDVGLINSSLQVFSLAFSSSGVALGLSFQAAQTCSGRFPITSYSVIIDGGMRVPLTASATSGAAVRQTVDIALQRDRQFMVAIEACSTVVCRISNTTNLNTTDVQTAQVVFFENNIFLRCRFANGSQAQGCAVLFKANQNGSGAATEEFRVQRSGDLGTQCNASTNQRNGYMRFSVFDLEQNGMSLGAIAIPVEEKVLETEEEYMQQTGCAVIRDVVEDRTAVAIAVPILVVFFFIVLATGAFLFYYFYYRHLQKYRLVKNRKPRLMPADDTDDLVLDIESNNAEIIKEPMAPGIKPYESLHPSTPVQTDGSIRKECHPVEVELHQDKIRLRVNKSALKAVARFHMLVKKQHSEASVTGTLNQLDKVSLMALSGRAPSKVHFSKDFSDVCSDLMSVKEVEEDEEGLRSWAVFHYDPPTDVSPPDSMTTSPTQKLPLAWEHKQ